jgi:HEAT repeat protein
LQKKYDPIADLTSQSPVDRYAATKALARREDLAAKALPALETLLAAETEERVALEAAGSAAVLGSQRGREKIKAALWENGPPEFRMEAVLILTELGSDFEKEELLRVASDPKFQGDEIRQAAIWGLGKSGLKAYDVLRTFISDPEDNTAMHAVMAHGHDTPPNVIAALIADLNDADQRRATAASEALRVIGSKQVVQALAATADTASNWVVATLGRMPPQLVRDELHGKALLARIEPLLLLNAQANWLASEDRVLDLTFLSKQDVEARN